MARTIGEHLIQSPLPRLTAQNIAMAPAALRAAGRAGKFHRDCVGFQTALVERFWSLP